MGTTTTVYVFSGAKVIAEYVNGALSKEYVYAGNNLLTTIAADGTTTYQHPDHLSTRVETDASGNVARTFGHFPFGESWYENGATNKWKFTTYERDSESGLDQAIFRYDSSRLGRFMSPDPLAGRLSDPQSLNRYTYVRNDPGNLVDPFGLCVPSEPCPPPGPDDPPSTGDPSDVKTLVVVDAFGCGLVVSNGSGGFDAYFCGGGGGGGGVLPNAAKALSKQKLDKKKCQQDLAALGITADEVHAGALAANFINGVGSNVPLSSLYASSPVPSVSARAATVSGTVGDKLKEPGIVAVAQLGLPNIYFNPGLINASDYYQNLGVVFHEVTHNITGLTDEDLQRALGLNENGPTDNITKKLIRDCF